MKILALTIILSLYSVAQADDHAGKEAGKLRPIFLGTAENAEPSTETPSEVSKEGSDYVKPMRKYKGQYYFKTENIPGQQYEIAFYAKPAETDGAFQNKQDVVIYKDGQPVTVKPEAVQFKKGDILFQTKKDGPWFKAPAEVEEIPDDELVPNPLGLDLSNLHHSVIEKVNRERKQRGLGILRVAKGLMRTAAAHTAWMTNSRRMVHGSYNVGENIAMGQSNPGEVMNAWMNSSGHRANILNAGYSTIGVGVYQTVEGTKYWTQQFR